MHVICALSILSNEARKGSNRAKAPIPKLLKGLLWLWLLRKVDMSVLGRNRLLCHHGRAGDVRCA